MTASQTSHHDSPLAAVLKRAQAKLTDWETAQRRRTCPVLARPELDNPDEAICGPSRRTTDGRWLRNFSANDYLGLSTHPALIEASMTATRRVGVGAGASRLVSGTDALIETLERELAAFKGTESALVLNSGYQANVSILQALIEPEDWVFCDRLNHASLNDGVLLARARMVRYRHLDAGHLEAGLQKAPADAVKWIVTDSVFSMDGDCADLPTLCDLAERYGALLLIDEAHGTGVFGERKRSGLAEAQGVSQRVALHMGTFSKALGGFGAYVAGPDVLMEMMVNRGRGFVYSTALPPGVIAANLAALRLVQAEDCHTQRLWRNIHHFRQTIANAPPLARRVPPIASPIIPVMLGADSVAVAVSRTLRDNGFHVQAIRPPTVPEGTARLRVSLSAAHTLADLDELVEALLKALRTEGNP
jgi:8-amino-7-oxononanoate synthase